MMWLAEWKKTVPGAERPAGPGPVPAAQGPVSGAVPRAERPPHPALPKAVRQVFGAAPRGKTPRRSPRGSRRTTTPAWRPSPARRPCSRNTAPGSSPRRSGRRTSRSSTTPTSTGTPPSSSPRRPSALRSSRRTCPPPTTSTSTAGRPSSPCSSGRTCSCWAGCCSWRSSAFPRRRPPGCCRCSWPPGTAGGGCSGRSWPCCWPRGSAGVAASSLLEAGIFLARGFCNDPGAPLYSVAAMDDCGLPPLPGPGVPAVPGDTGGGGPAVRRGGLCPVPVAAAGGLPHFCRAVPGGPPPAVGQRPRPVPLRRRRLRGPCPAVGGPRRRVPVAPPLRDGRLYGGPDGPGCPPLPPGAVAVSSMSPSCAVLLHSAFLSQPGTFFQKSFPPLPKPPFPGVVVG